MVDINPTSTPGAWQGIINANAAGTTYVVKSGIHRYQTITPKDGDTFEFENGAVVTGGDNLGTSGWTAADGLWYKDGISRGTTTGGQCNSGYECGQLNCIVIDGELKGWRTTKAAVTKDTAFYDSGRVWVGVNPALHDYVEICRTQRFINLCAVDDVTLKAQGGTDRVGAGFKGIIRAYASAEQARQAAIAGGYADSKPGWDTGGNGEAVGSGWLFQDLDIHGHAGCGIVLPDQSTLRRSRVASCGQLNVGHNRTDDVVYEYSIIENGNANGWRAGWEGGNIKIARSTDDIVRGCLWRISGRLTNSDGRVTGVLWWDIDNDGAECYDTIVVSGGGDESRGIFHEIGGSMHFYRNKVLRVSRDSEAQGWAKSFLSSHSGGLPGTTRFDKCYVYENFFYECGGLGGGVQNRNRGTWEYFRGIDAHTTSIGSRVLRHMHFKDNLEVVAASNKYTPRGGYVDWDSGYTPPDHMIHLRNCFISPTPTAQHFDNQVAGGSTGLTWSQWQNEGYDTEGRMLARTSHPSRNPHPLNGGAG